MGALSYDLAHGTAQEQFQMMQTIFLELLDGIRLAPSLVEVNVAAGIAYNAVNALSSVVPS